MLAGQNAVRSPRRTAATASALTVGLTLNTGLTVIGTSANKSTDALATANLRGDYVVSMANAGPLAASTDETLSALDEVAASSPRREIQARVDGTDQTVVGFDAKDVDELLDLGFTKGTFVSENTAVVDQPTATAHGWRLGDSSRCRGPTAPRAR
ncbi:MAG: ABC transporter permease [Actinomycetes bacterium]